MRTLYLCGAGNSEGVRLALRVRDAGGLRHRIVLLDDDPATHGTSLLGVEVAGPFDLLAEADPALDAAVNLVARTTTGRRRAADRIASFGVPATGLVAPGVDTLGADLASDVLVYPGAHVGPEVVIAPGSVVFMGAVVGHESTVGPGCVIAANAVLNARVRLGDGVYVGANATLLPEIEVGAGATVGAGSTVASSVPAGATVLGVPAVLLGRNEADADGPDRPTPGAPEVESAIVEAWSEVLGVPTVRPDARVFELGATSLEAVRVSTLLQRSAGIDVSVVDLFRCATPRELAGYLTSRAAAVGGANAGVRAVAREIAPQSPGHPRRSDDARVEAIAEIFRYVLGLPTAGADSHFFDLGGDPTAAEEVCRILRRTTGSTVCFMQVARFPTPRELAAHLETSAGGPPDCPARGVMNRLVHRRERQRG